MVLPKKLTILFLIAFSFILGIVLTFGFFQYKSQTIVAKNPQQIKPSSIIIPSPDNDLQTYKNEKFGYEIKLSKKVKAFISEDQSLFQITGFEFVNVFSLQVYENPNLLNDIAWWQQFGRIKETNFIESAINTGGINRNLDNLTYISGQSKNPGGSTSDETIIIKSHNDRIYVIKAGPGQEWFMNSPEINEAREILYSFRFTD